MFNLFGLFKKKEAKKKVEDIRQPYYPHTSSRGRSYPYSSPTPIERKRRDQESYVANNSDLGYSSPSVDWGNNSDNSSNDSGSHFGGYGGGDSGGAGGGGSWSDSSRSSSDSSDSGSSDCGSSSSD